MKLETSIKLLQIFGGFPVYFKGSESTNKEPSLSKKFSCCALLQLAVASKRLYEIYSIFTSRNAPLTKVIYSVECSWMISSILLTLGNVYNISRCIQGSDVIKRNITTFRTFGFFNFCLQVGSSALLIFQGLPRSSLSQNILSFFTFYGIVVVSLSSYILLLFLRIILVSFRHVNQTLSSLSDTMQDLSQLGSLIETHWQTGNMIPRLNRAFGLHILCFSGFTFVKFTLVVYFLTVSKGFATISSKRASVYSYMFLSLYSMLTILFDFLVLCVTSHLVTSERHKTMVLLQRLMRRRACSLTKGLKQQVRLFMFQAKSRQLELSGYDFFSVNKPMFYGMVMVVISYFILLVQFGIFQ